MNEPATDLRVIKTHKTIRSALIELLDEMPFDKISVQDILDRALVNRSTFYRYYSGKSGLAGKMIADFKRFYAEQLAAQLASDNLTQAFVQTSEIMFKEHRTLLALWKIETRRHHLKRDMFDMLRHNYLTFAAHNSGDLAYQAELYAHLVLKTAEYFFSQGKPIPIKQAQGDFLEMMAVLAK